MKIRGFRLPRAAGAAMLCVSLAASAGTSSQQLSCTSSPLIDNQLDASLAAVDSQGRSFLLLSREDLSGSNADGSQEVFRVDLETGQALQLTDAPQSPLLCGQERVEQFTRLRSVSDDLSRFIFESCHDLDGSNAAGEDVLYLYDGVGEQIRRIGGSGQVSDGVPTGQAAGRAGSLISGDGKRVIYSIPVRRPVAGSEGQPCPPGSERLEGESACAFFTRDLFLHEVEGGSDVLLFQGRLEGEPLLGGVSVDGGRFVFFYESTPGAFLYSLAERSYVPLPTGGSAQETGAITRPRLSSDGATVAFRSADDLIGGNPDGSREIYVWKPDLGPGQSNLIQITDLRLGAQVEESPSDWYLSDDGSRLAYTVRRIRDYFFLGEIFRRTDTIEQLLVYDSEDQRTSRILGGYTRVDIANDGKETIGGRPFKAPTSIELSADASRLAFTAEFEEGSRTLYYSECKPLDPSFFPQVGNGTSGEIRFQTALVLTNNGAATTVELEFFDSFGIPLQVAFNEHSPSSRFDVTLRRGESVALTTLGTGPVAVGYARLLAQPSVGGTAIFTRSEASTGTILYEAGVPMTSTLNEFSIPVDTITLGNRDTGLAMSNPPDGGVDTRVTLRLYTQNFKLLDVREIDLSSGHHMARYVSEIFPQVMEAHPDGLRGILSGVSDHPVSVVALRQGGEEGFPDSVPTLTAFPVTPGRPELERPVLVVLPENR